MVEKFIRIEMPLGETSVSSIGGRGRVPVRFRAPPCSFIRVTKVTLSPKLAKTLRDYTPIARSNTG